MIVATTTEYRLGPATEIPVGEGREFALGGQLVAVFHTRGGSLYATQALCPHREGPLIDGLIGGTTLMCPLHAWKFNLATGEALMGSCGLTTYPVRRDADENIILTLMDEPPHPHSGEACENVGYNVFSREEVDGEPLPASGS